MKGIFHIVLIIVVLSQNIAWALTPDSKAILSELINLLGQDPSKGWELFNSPTTIRDFVGGLRQEEKSRLIGFLRDHVDYPFPDNVRHIFRGLLQSQVDILVTGGTICMGSRPVRGFMDQRGIIEKLTETLKDRIYSILKVFSNPKDSSDLGYKDIVKLINAIEESDRPLVITHGTDLLAETGFNLSLYLQKARQPVVLAASFDTVDQPNSDARPNMEDSINLASDPFTPPFVYVVMNGEIHLASRIVKVDTKRGGIQSFGGPVGEIRDGKIRFNPDFLRWTVDFKVSERFRPNFGYAEIMYCNSHTPREVYESAVRRLSRMKSETKDVGLVIEGEVPRDKLELLLSNGIQVYTEERPFTLSAMKIRCKLALLLGQGYPPEVVKQKMEQDFCGEMVVDPHSRKAYRPGHNIYENSSTHSSFIIAFQDMDPGIFRDEIDRLHREKGKDPSKGMEMVIEGYGDGHIQRKYIPILRKAIRSGIRVIMLTNARKAVANLDKYPIGRELKRIGVIGGKIHGRWYLRSDETEKEFYSGLISELGVVGTIIDVGCSTNTGPLEGAMEADRRNICVGVDYIDRTHIFSKLGLGFREGYAHELPFDGESVNAVIFNESLYHIARSNKHTEDFDDNLGSALNEVHRVLAHDGWIIIRPSSDQQQNQYIAQHALAQLGYLGFKDITIIRDESRRGFISCIYAQKPSERKARFKNSGDDRGSGKRAVNIRGVLSSSAGEDDLPQPWIIDEIRRREEEERKRDQDRPRVPAYDYDDPNLPPGWEPPKQEEPPKRGVITIITADEEGVTEEKKRPKVISVLRVLSWVSALLLEIEEQPSIVTILKAAEDYIREIRAITEDEGLNSILDSLLSNIGNGLNAIETSLEELIVYTEVDSLKNMIIYLRQALRERRTRDVEVMAKLFRRLNYELRKEVLVSEGLDILDEPVLIGRKIRELGCDFEDLDVLLSIIPPSGHNDYEYLFRSIYDARQISYWQIGRIRGFYERHKVFLEDIPNLKEFLDPAVRLKKALRIIKRAEIIAHLEKSKGGIRWPDNGLATPIDVINTMRQLEFYMTFVVRDLALDLMHTGYPLTIDYKKLVEDDYELKDRWLAVKALLRHSEDGFVKTAAPILLELAIELLDRSRDNHSKTGILLKDFQKNLEKSKVLFIEKFKELAGQMEKTRAERDRYSEGDDGYEIYDKIFKQQKAELRALEDKISRIEFEILKLDGLTQENEREKQRISDVLELFSRFEDYNGDKESVDLNEVIDEITRIANRKGIRITVKKPDTTISMELNKSELSLALLNLVLNAEQSRREGQDIVNIDISVLLKDLQWIEIVISNDGELIPQDIIYRIFEPFFGTKGRIGIGLSFVKKVVDAYGGEIKIISSPEEGTKFILRLPMPNQIERFYPQLVERITAIYPNWDPPSIEELSNILVRGEDWSSLVSAMRADGIDAEDTRAITAIGEVISAVTEGTLLTARDKALLTSAVAIRCLSSNNKINLKEASFRYRLQYFLDLWLDDSDVILQDIETLMTPTQVQLFKTALAQKGDDKKIVLFTTREDVDFNSIISALGLGMYESRIDRILNRKDYAEGDTGLADALIRHVSGIFNREARHIRVITTEGNAGLWDGLSESLRALVTIFRTDGRIYLTSENSFIDREITRTGLKYLVKTDERGRFIDLSKEIDRVNSLNLDTLARQILEDSV